MPAHPEAPDRVLGQRYRLIAALGSGASANVYLAEDQTLARRVAVKLLHPAFVDEAAFLRRFAQEARAVAQLNHPHLLRVYDWGESPQGPYIVAEWLTGGSLRDILDRNGPLPINQVAKLGAEAAQGLAYAHARGLVHRDVKPANLLFDEEGRVRVADFGVSRALSETAWSEPEGSIVGTARYCSPEQASGARADGRSDVYGLSLVLYEAVTGIVPFDSDTLVATLMARIGAPLPPHQALGPLYDILVAGADPDQEHRIDAHRLALELEVLTTRYDPPSPLPLVTNPAVVPLSDPDQTQSLSGDPDATEGLWIDPDRTEFSSLSTTRSDISHTMVVPPSVQPFDFDQQRKADVPAHARSADGGGGRRALAIIALVVVLAAAGVAGAIATKVFVPSVAVPQLQGLSLSAARALAVKDHLNVAVTGNETSKVYGAGIVLDQSPTPAAGSKVKEHTTIDVTISSGPPPVNIPSLAGETCTGAQRLLTAQGLNGSCPAAAEQYSSTVASGTVISWSYGSTQNPAQAPYGSSIVVVLSKGHAPVAVPNVDGDASYADAQAALSAQGFGSAESMQSSTTVAAGTVIASSPAAGTSAPYGSTVTVIVSSGPPTAPIPDVDGDTVDQAESALQAAGFVVGSVYGPGGGTVFATDPSEGSTEPVGTTVDIYTVHNGF